MQNTVRYTENDTENDSLNLNFWNLPFGDPQSCHEMAK